MLANLSSNERVIWLRLMPLQEAGLVEPAIDY